MAARQPNLSLSILRSRVHTSGVLFSSKVIPSTNFGSSPKINSVLSFLWLEK
jgi:hypothetical protein